MDWAFRAMLGASISGLVAAPAWRLGALTSSGALAAGLIGTVLFAGGGWPWLLLVGAFFVPASVLTRLTPPGAGRLRNSLDREGRRWDQVIANGGIAAVAAAITGLSGWPLGFGAAAGALAVAAADTWGTEVGRWSSAQPRLVTTGAFVPRGTSGGVTLLGTVGELAGAVTVAAVAALVGQGHDRLFLASAVAGFSGARVDSLLGATVEGRLRWVDNSVVNLLATAWGAVVALALLAWWHP